ncbi:hypothetical protein C1H57_08780 [Clostridium sp. 2-1]|uniref:hypothetical protein n=1 Tax=Clostridium TaxID=1485 RepID=UPI000CDA1083|nr:MULTISPECIES: hypothetical protein [Clostridium]MBN7574338.1 hypothetical protein [Clostridium beijerinckii]MBN7579395.1 hypothetical protein [Clostridium beijerinckii]MBN7584088.1 hypothetical protein [Clostridium beijerinckii]MBO0520031.1 hypothetical protein [Clostridium beijerinckii]POO91743.1 hypothetical protein C1H57_08780 [Clostridium sp. 2-1]
MKKYLNKGLLYAWFNSAKAAIFIGLLIWGAVAYEIIKNNLNDVRNGLANNFDNYYYTNVWHEYFMLAIIFVAIYFIAKGINKRNTEMFLCSGPYTKKQIRYNEFICLLITLILFVITYVYIAIVSYFGNAEFISVVEGYWNIVTVETSKIILLGIIGIMFMLIIDLMFSNSVIGFISMISVIPVSISIIIAKVISILEYFGVNKDYSLLDKIEGLDYNVKLRGFCEIVFNRISVKDIIIRHLWSEMVSILFIIIIMIIVYSVVQNKYKLENANKIFSSQNNEKILVTLVSTAVGSFASLFLTESFIHSLQLKNGSSRALIGSDLVKGLGLDIICIFLIGFIAYKVMKRILKNIV